MTGTVMVRDIYTGTGDSNPEGLVAVGSTLYFVADDGSGKELWKSDGTEAGTTRVMDIYPGPDGSEPVHLTMAGDRLFFGADDGSHGKELWAILIYHNRIYLPLVVRNH
jgi:ELWxxDGT repeat protein